MKQTVTVIEKKLDSYLVGCDKSACNGCHNELFCKSKDNTFIAMNPDGVEKKKGETVEVDIPEGKAITSILLSLGLPLILFIPGYFFGKLFTQNELLLGLFGACGIALGFLASGIFFRIKAKEYSPVVLKDKD